MGAGKNIYLNEVESVASPTVFLEGLFTALINDSLNGDNWLLLMFQELICMWIYQRIKIFY